MEVFPFSVPPPSRSISLQIMDILSHTERSQRMSRIRGKDTKPEMTIRRLVHSMGFRYRLHSGGLPGRPDLVFAGRKKVIFVNGCFWHRHTGCRAGSLPKSNIAFWREKLNKNAERDRSNIRKLEDLGWSVMTIWQCEISDHDLPWRISDFLTEASRDSHRRSDSKLASCQNESLELK